jgi:hypothetical protein
VSQQNGRQKIKIKNDEIHFLNFDINKAMHFICVLSTVNMVIFKYVMVEIDLSVCGNSSSKTMAGKRKQ